MNPKALDEYLPAARAGERRGHREVGGREAPTGRVLASAERGRSTSRPADERCACGVDGGRAQGHPFEPVVAEVRTSLLGGRFEPPQFLLRDGVDYDLFVQFVGVLALSGYGDDEVALGLGVRELDVVIACALARRTA